MHIVAARVRDSRGVIEHSLYWATAASEDEAHYLCAILNSARVTELVRPLMSYGKDERHVDKYVWQLPIPMFDAKVELHAQLAELGRQAEREICELDLDDSKYFVAQRRTVRNYLAESETGGRIEKLVATLLR